MKKVLILFLVILISAVSNLNPKDNSSDDKKFPGVFGAEFEQDFQFDTIGAKPGTNLGWSDVYLKSRGKGQVAFSFNFDKKKAFNSTEGLYYTITPWVQDAVELPMNFGNGTPVTLNTKNNFYVGLDNTFMIENVCSIDLGYEFRLGSCLGQNPVTGTYDGLEVRISPYVNLSGSYDFGLSWNINQYFEFYFFPGLGNNLDSGTYTSADIANSRNLQFTEFEGIYNLSYEFLHFIKNNNKIKASLYGELYLWARYLNEGHYVLNYFTNSNGIDNSIGSLNGNLIRSLDPAIGLTFDIYSFTPFVLFYVHSVGDSKSSSLSGSVIGIKCGLGYTKDWFTFSLVYYGMINSNPKSEINQWMNHVETYIIFKIGT